MNDIEYNHYQLQNGSVVQREYEVVELRIFAFALQQTHQERKEWRCQQNDHREICSGQFDHLAPDLFQEVRAHEINLVI